MRGYWGANNLGGTEKAELLKSCTLIQCAPGRCQGATVWALKFRSMVMEMGDLFYSVFPEAKLLFLYRNAVPWARSFLRIMGISDPAAPVPLARVRALVGGVNPHLERRETASGLELLASIWVSITEKCLEMRRRGIPIFIARYEELNAAPREVLAAMFDHCALSANAVGNLDAVLGADSQEGTPLSRASVGEAPVPVSREHLDELCRLIAEFSPELTADTILPGTYFPRPATEPTA
jgi:hypothetical protein